MSPFQLAGPLPHSSAATGLWTGSRKVDALNRLRDTGGAVLLALAYYLGARIGFALQSPTVPQSILWLPNSILLSALLLAPRRQWPVYFVAVYPAHLAVALHAGAPLFTLSILYLTNWLDAGLGASLVLHFVRAPVSLGRLRNMIYFLVLAAWLSTLLVSFADSAVTVLTGWHTDYWGAWSTRARSNLLTNVVWVPAVLGMREVIRAQHSRFNWRDVAGGLSLILLTAGVALVAFAYPTVKGSPAILYAPTPILLVGALYFGVGVLGVQLLLVALAASWSLLHGRLETAAEVFALQVFLYAMAVPLLCFASLATERRRTTIALHASERRVRRQFARLHTIYATTPVGLAFVDTQRRVVNANHQILALAEGRESDQKSDIHQCLPALAPYLEPLLYHVFHEGEAVREREMTIAPRIPGGQVVDCLVTCAPVRDAFGELIGCNIAVQDVTERNRADLALRESYRELQESKARGSDLAGRMITAQEIERTRMARELHDDFSQRLADIAIELGLIRKQLSEKFAIRERINRARVTTMELSAAMRDLSHNLHPAVLKHAGLVAALQSSCVRFAKQQGIGTTCDAEEVGRVSDEVALCLYRIAQEALSNVSRHARAGHVEVRLIKRLNILELTVADDGVGFDPRMAVNHLGLVSAQERARLLNGSVTIETTRGHGTIVRAMVPMRELQPQPA